MIETKSPNRLKHASVEVLWRNGDPIEVVYNGTRLKYTKWAEKAYEGPVILDAKEIGAARWINKKMTKPSVQHPWK